jgi:hypothetical protein
MENTPSRVGVPFEPKRTAIVDTVRPSIIQRSVLLVLSMHSTRPVVQRGSGGSAGWPPMRYRSQVPGSRVMPRSRCQVTVSVCPVRGSPRLPWKPLTARSVDSSYVPVGPSKSQATCRSRAWSSRTSRPVSPRDHSTRAGAGAAPGLSSPDGAGAVPGPPPSSSGVRSGDGVSPGNSMCTGERRFPSPSGACTVQPASTAAPATATAIAALPMPVVRTRPSVVSPVCPDVT